MADLKCPFPYYGGKSRVASLVWQHIGDVDNFIEPFCGSAAVLLSRPTLPKVETLNDLDCMIANFWRATREAPEVVAEWADNPVNETDLHAVHRWLVLGDEAAAFRERMRTDPNYFDAKRAGRWVWGMCCWIGSGWCQTAESAAWSQTPKEASGLTGVCAGKDKKSKVRIAAHNRGSVGKGVHAKGQLPKLSSGDGVLGTPSPEVGGLAAKVPRLSTPAGQGVDALSEQLPKLQGYASGCVPESSGTHGRPQLADAPTASVGAHGNDSAGTCEQRRAWLLDWFSHLRDRLRVVRVCCGHWLRVCDSESVTTRLGTTGIFLDPPYPSHSEEGESRASGLYATDAGRDSLDKLRDEVLAYCLERGKNPMMRIAVCGYDTDGYAALEAHGWQCVAWRAQGGYGNRTDKGKANAGRERIWFSPHCHNEAGLFDKLLPPGVPPGDGDEHGRSDLAGK